MIYDNIHGATGTVGAENIASELKISPAHTSLRVRFMSVFCLSIATANAFPYTLQCIFGCIYGILALYPLGAAVAISSSTAPSVDTRRCVI
jgi:hypothetical protein